MAFSFATILRCDPPHDEGSITDALPAEVSETEKRKGFGFSLSTLLPVSSGEPLPVIQNLLQYVQ